MVSDLELCYDRKLSKIGRLVEESVGVNRSMMLMLSKVLPKCNYYIGTSHRISSGFMDVLMPV